MTYNEMSNFTYEELSHFTFSQLEQDKFQIVEYLTQHDNDISKDTIDKLYELCVDTVSHFNEISDQPNQIVLPPRPMDLKDKITCFGVIFSVFEKVISNEIITDTLSQCFKRLVDIINNLLQ